MSRPRVLISSKIWAPGPRMLRRYCDVDLWPHRRYPIPREELLRRVQDKDGILCTVRERIDGELMDRAPSLKVVSTYSVGYDHIDVDEATRRGIYVCHTPGVLTDAVADLTFALILAVARRIVRADRYLREGKWRGFRPAIPLGMPVYGRTLGIVGFGRIGRAVAERGRGFAMKILYFDAIRPPPDVERELGAEYSPLDDLLRRSDIVTLHVSLHGPPFSTYGLIGERELRLMKRNAILINTARGLVVNEGALVKALKERWIAGAGLDVYGKEPIEPDNPLIRLPNVVLTPHIGSGTSESRSKMAEIAAKNLIMLFKGRMPIALLNPDVRKVRPLSAIRMIE